MKTTNNSLPKNVLIGGLMTAATLFVAVMITRRKTLCESADHILDSCECALQRLGERTSATA